MIRTRFLVLLAAPALGCTPKVVSFTAAPVRFCEVPQRVELSWEVEGTGQLTATPATAEISTATPVASGTGSTTTTVAEDTTFSLTAGNTINAAVDHVTDPVVSRLSCEATCAGSILNCMVEIPNGMRDGGLVIRSITNESARELEINGVMAVSPGATIREPFTGMTATDRTFNLRSGVPLGVTCSATGPSYSETLSVSVEFGCPMR